MHAPSYERKTFFNRSSILQNTARSPEMERVRVGVDLDCRNNYEQRPVAEVETLLSISDYKDERQARDKPVRHANRRLC